MRLPFITITDGADINYRGPHNLQVSEHEVPRGNPRPLKGRHCADAPQFGDLQVLWNDRERLDIQLLHVNMISIPKVKNKPDIFSTYFTAKKPHKCWIDL